MKIKLLYIGSTSKKFLIEGEKEYTQRLKHYCQLELVELPDIKNRKNLTQDEVKKLEGEKMLAHLKDQEHVYLLDDKGKQYSSSGFADFLEKHQIYASKTLVFVIGGAFGFSQDIYNCAKGKISLSSLTFSHQMVRMIFLEQLYRGFTIIKGEKYHHE